MKEKASQKNPSNKKSAISKQVLENKNAEVMLIRR